jgi:hypothetical protein
MPLTLNCKCDLDHGSSKAHLLLVTRSKTMFDYFGALYSSYYFKKADDYNFYCEKRKDIHR